MPAHFRCKCTAVCRRRTCGALHALEEDHDLRCDAALVVPRCEVISEHHAREAELSMAAFDNAEPRQYRLLAVRCVQSLSALLRVGADEARCTLCCLHDANSKGAGAWGSGH